MALRPGHAVGPYEILAELGRGGMGTVYLARDRRLGRDVALKFLHPPHSGVDPTQWRQRLTREARAASALNHPNICHIYDIGGEGADSWIAMEYVDGPSLRSTIGRGALPVDAAVKIAAQLADALAHAHAHGILHRDLTGTNVLTDADGRARILDFGIAERLPEEVAHEATHTGTAPVSEAFAGTLPYLAPEILKGAPAAPQTDLWSLGVLLYEMLAGTRPFQGRTMLEIVSAILESTPRALPSRVPAPIARIVGRLLMKNPADRYRSAVEVAAALDAVHRPRARAWRPTIAVAVAAAVVVVLSLLAYRAWSVRRFSPLRVSQQRLLSTTGVSQRTPAFAPDGRRLAFVAPDERGVQQIWVRNLSDEVAIQVTSGDGGASRPRWSAIDDRIIFSRPGGGIWSVSPLGGAQNQITDRGTNPDVSRDGARLVFEDQRSLWIADRDGSNVREITGVPPVFYRVPMGPAFSPDGAEIAFFRPEMGPNGDIWVVAAAGGEPRRLTSDLREGGWPAWTPDGRAIVFSSGRAGSRTLWEVPARGGDPVPLTSGAGEDDQPTISADGRQLAYTNVRNTWDLRVQDLATGDERSLLQRGLELLFPRFSPDGSRLAFFGRLDRAVAIFSIGVDGSDLRQLTGGRELNHQPRWSSDGRSVYFFQVAPTTSFRRVPVLGGASTPFRDWGWETHYAPEFDPVGRLVAYVRERGPGEPQGEPARTVLHEIATGQERYWPPPHIHVTGWSADGAMAVGSRDDEAMLMCTVPDGACRPLGQGTQPVWPGGGNRIYFRKPAADGITQELWSMGTDGQGQAFVATLGRFRPIDPWVDVSRLGVAAWARFEAGLHQLWAATIE